jgi:hypothetical protein
MAILNNLTNQTRYMSQWQDALSKAFNSVREFNAHRATYGERIRLLQALKSIDQRWEPLVEEAIKAFEQDWRRRTDQAVGTIVDLLKGALTYRYSRTVKEHQLIFARQREEVKTQVMVGFEEGLRDLEIRAQEQIRANFRHNVWNMPPDSILGKDLLSEEVNQALGLSKRQLALVGMAAGAASGATIDLSTAGHSLGAGALIGAATGGVLGFVGSKALAKLDIERAPGTRRFTVGPVHNPRFPFVLVDRIVLYSARAMNWAHGRQAADEEAPDKVPDRTLRRAGFTEALSATQQRDLARFFNGARKGKPDREQEFREIIREILTGLARSEIDSRADL